MEILIPDEMLERLGTYYSHEFTQNNLPWVTALPFEQWLEKQLRRMYGDQWFIRGEEDGRGDEAYPVDSN